MRRPRKAVDAAVFATSIGIDARLEADIGTVVAGDYRLRQVAVELRRKPRALPGLWFGGIEINVESLETIRRISRRSASRTNLVRDRLLVFLVRSDG